MKIDITNEKISITLDNTQERVEVCNTSCTIPVVITGSKISILPIPKVYFTCFQCGKDSNDGQYIGSKLHEICTNCCEKNYLNVLDKTKE